MIDENIKKIERPKNTILKATKNPNVYMVIERIGCKYDHGRRLPQNGKVIGHVIDGAYVGKTDAKKKLSERAITVTRYGSVAFADKMGRDLIASLDQVYAPNDAMNIYNLALMRASFGDVKDYQIEEKYEKSYASILYPKRAVSKNSVSKLIEQLGSDFAGIHQFMENRVKEMVTESTKILIDGMLKNNTTNVNSFAGFSYKGRIKGTTDISIICAIDAEKKEPICTKVYRGNLPDCVNSADFFEEFNLPNGLAITDKGLDPSKIKEKYPDSKIAYLCPIKRGSKVISKLGLSKGLEYVPGGEKHILGKKSKQGDVFYYSFVDLDRKSKEEHDYVGGKRDKMDPAKYEKKKDAFGSVTFKSNLDLTLKEVYDYYALRWQIELIFRMYKGILSLNTTRVHDNPSVIGTEFINFLSVIMTCRMKNRLNELGCFKNDSFGNILDRLSNIIKTSTDGKEWKFCTLNAKEKDLLEKLGI